MLESPKLVPDHVAEVKSIRRMEVRLPEEVTRECAEVAKLIDVPELEVREAVRSYVEKSFHAMPDVRAIYAAHLDSVKAALGKK